jgi:hypothetical protein
LIIKPMVDWPNPFFAATTMHAVPISRAKTARVVVLVATVDLALITVALDVSLSAMPLQNVENMRRSLEKPVH